MKHKFVTKDVRTARPVSFYGTALVAWTLTALPHGASAQTTTAKYPAQRIQVPTAAEVTRAWKNPPAEYGPEPYFGMNGPVTIESLSHDLDTMKSLGFHAVTAQAGGGMPVTYLTPEYFAFFKQFVLEAKKRDMKVWIVDDIGYPSGFAGGIFADSKGNHNLSMQALTIGQRIAVKPGGTTASPSAPTPSRQPPSAPPASAPPYLSPAATSPGQLPSAAIGRSNSSTTSSAPRSPSRASRNVLDRS